MKKIMFNDRFGLTKAVLEGKRNIEGQDGWPSILGTIGS